MLASQPSRFGSWKTLLAAAVLALAIVPSTLQAQTEDHADPGQQEAEAAPETTPSILLQYASAVNVGQTMTISRAPVTTSAGALIYEDITVQFAVGAGGQITVAPGYPKYALSPNLLVAGFQAGTYVGPVLNTSDKLAMGFALTGPGIGAGATAWSIALASGYDPCTTPGNATFWVGPLASSPIEARLAAAKITSIDWSYGVLGTQDCGHGRGYAWSTDGLVGFSQVGDTITVASFSFGGTDYNTPQDTFTYTLK